MLASRLDTLAMEWNDALEALGVDIGSTAVVVGPNAEIVAEGLLLASTPPLVASTGHVALLGIRVAEDRIETASPRSVPLEDGTVDSFFAIHAWGGRAGLPEIVAEGRRLVRPGGSVVMAELDVGLLAASNPRQYPSALIPLTQPEAFARLVGDCVDRSALELEALRAGLADVASHQTDVTIGRYPDPTSHAIAVGGGLWRGSRSMTKEQLDQLAQITAGIERPGDIVDREPWVLVRGVRRS